MIIIATKPCACGAPATIREHAEADAGKHWSVRCSRKRAGMTGRHGFGQTACRESETIYASTQEYAVGRWNAQFMPVAECLDGAPRCRCGLRMPCNQCLGPVEQYARSGRPAA